ncbi:hypothetical protein OESDEN_07929 [Oesophagostomum dentatum]|uniref:Uncharacterized protein n=1 Tax=Oesophagostomum dentatum TaxID=61180 RepID=A0A0B1T8S7_OESDE|nr:hypothetical protein OESDEN_07929 [Oesophagostomum dentatum]
MSRIHRHPAPIKQAAFRLLSKETAAMSPTRALLDEAKYGHPIKDPFYAQIQTKLLTILSIAPAQRQPWWPPWSRPSGPRPRPRPRPTTPPYCEEWTRLNDSDRKAIRIGVESMNSNLYYNCFLEYGGDLYIKSKEKFNEDPVLKKSRVGDYMEYHLMDNNPIYWNLTGFAQYGMKRWVKLLTILSIAPAQWQPRWPPWSWPSGPRPRPRPRPHPRPTTPSYCEEWTRLNDSDRKAIRIGVESINPNLYYNCFLEYGGDLFIKSKEKFNEDPVLKKSRVGDYIEYHLMDNNPIYWNLTGFAQYGMKRWVKKAKSDETEFGCGYSSRFAAEYSKPHNPIQEERLVCIFK